VLHTLDVFTVSALPERGILCRQQQENSGSAMTEMTVRVNGEMYLRGQSTSVSW
jgi:hypothetical protein